MRLGKILAFEPSFSSVSSSHVTPVPGNSFFDSLGRELNIDLAILEELMAVDYGGNIYASHIEDVHEFT